MARPREEGSTAHGITRGAARAGSDAEFRRLIHDLIAYGHKLDACRDAFAAIAGISGAQYEILMLVSRADGLSIGEVAARMHRSGAFITIEANKLVGAGSSKRLRPRTMAAECSCVECEKGVQLLERMAPYQRRVNDVLFEFARREALSRAARACRRARGVRRPRGGDARGCCCTRQRRRERLLLRALRRRGFRGERRSSSAIAACTFRWCGLAGACSAW